MRGREGEYAAYFALRAKYSGEHDMPIPANAQRKYLLPISPFETNVSVV